MGLEWGSSDEALLGELLSGHDAPALMQVRAALASNVNACTWLRSAFQTRAQHLRPPGFNAATASEQDWTDWLRGLHRTAWRSQDDQAWPGSSARPGRQRAYQATLQGVQDFLNDRAAAIPVDIGPLHTERSQKAIGTEQERLTPAGFPANSTSAGPDGNTVALFAATDLRQDAHRRFAFRILQLRLGQGMRQTPLAVRLHCTQPVISRYENPDRPLMPPDLADKWINELTRHAPQARKELQTLYEQAAGQPCSWNVAAADDEALPPALLPDDWHRRFATLPRDVRMRQGTCREDIAAQQTATDLRQDAHRRFAFRILQLRLGQGMRQTPLAVRLHCTQPVISRYENPDRPLMPPDLADKWINELTRHAPQARKELQTLYEQAAGQCSWKESPAGGEAPAHHQATGGGVHC